MIYYSTLRIQNLQDLGFLNIKKKNLYNGSSPSWYQCCKTFQINDKNTFLSILISRKLLTGMSLTIPKKYHVVLGLQ